MGRESEEEKRIRMMRKRRTHVDKAPINPTSRPSETHRSKRLERGAVERDGAREKVARLQVVW